MKKKTKYRGGFRVRELPPSYRRDKDGNVTLLCPFCKPPHPIVPGTPSTCGTVLRVMAVQQVITARLVRAEGLTCIKCGQVGQGEMVRYMQSYVHVEECAPEKQLLTDVPARSFLAKIVYHLPSKLRGIAEKLTGQASAVHGLTPEGEPTGEIEFYFFGKVVENG